MSSNVNPTQNPTQHLSQTPAPILPELKAGQLFRHYKGGEYEIVCEAIQEADLTWVVVYRSARGGLWTRPKAEFLGTLQLDGVTKQRFSLIE
jgi:hypothetical protein